MNQRDEQLASYKELAETQAERIHALIFDNQELKARMERYLSNEQKYRLMESGHVQMLYEARAKLAALEAKLSEVRTINVNEYVWVKLTPAGQGVIGPLTFYYDDAGAGWSRWQLWTLMQMFGPRLYMGHPEMYFEGNKVALTAPNQGRQP